MSEGLFFSNYDMSNIYKYIIKEHPDYIDIIPMQFIVVDKMPNFIKQEHTEENVIQLVEHNRKSGLCLILKTEDMIENLDKIYSGEKKLISYMVDSIYDVTSIPIDTRLSPKRIKKIYDHAIQIAQKLNIQIPAVIIADDYNGKQGETIHLMNEDETDAINHIVIIVTRETLGMICSLAHEFRHIWQICNNKYDFDKYVLEDKGLDYLYQNEEIDANSFGCAYLESLGYDDSIHYAFESFDEYSHPFWKDYIATLRQSTNAIKQQMNL